MQTGLQAQAKYGIGDVQRELRDRPELKLQEEDINELSISSQYYDERAKVTHVYLQQNYAGLPIKEGTLGMHFDRNGEVVYVANRLVTNVAAKINTTTPKISPNQALQTALQQLGMKAGRLAIKETVSPTEVVFAKGGISVYDIPVRLLFELNNSGELVLAWESRVYPLDEQNYWVFSVNAQTGAEVQRTDLVVHCTFEKEGHVHGATCTQDQKAEQPAIPTAQEWLAKVMTPGANFYRVYDAPIEAPTFGDRTLVGAAGDPTASPIGWHNDGVTDHFITRGNNVYAYQDPGPASTGIPAVGGLPGQQPLVFDFAADLSLTPANYRDAAITNLFYWNNVIHDIFYYYGFTEPAGNFQQTNFGKGGEGLDAVLAEAQDGSGVNNANFLTLADGLPGRMQMFLWTSVPIIDGDFDNGVILHEYGHGISIRLTGGPAQTCLGGDEQGGEGWSDYFGLMVTMKPESVPSIFAEGRGIGTYVLNEPTTGDGIRPAKYSTDFAVNDFTYDDIDAAGISAPHGVGFIWATMLWEMTAKLVDVYGYDPDIQFGNGGNNMALQLVMTGLTLQPCSPTFVEQRDAILAADQLLYGGANKCLIWEAFAKRGLGFSASSGTNARGDEIEAFDMPPAFCQPTIDMTTEVPSLVTDGEAMNVNLLVTNNSAATISGVTVTNDIPTGFSVAGASQSYKVKNGKILFQNLTIPAESTKQLTVTFTPQTGSTAAMLLRDDLEANPFGWTASPGVDQFKWSTADAFSGDYAWFGADPNNFGNQLLTWNETITVTEGTHLRFAHRYNTEANFDGGLVEISNDGGLTWTDMGPLFVQNGYNDFVTLADNALINGFCFAGNSGGWIHSLADLSPFSGQTVQVRFRLASDVLTAAEGWYIDDMEVVNDPFLIENVAGYSMANGFVTGTFTDEVLVLGANDAAAAGAAFAKAGVQAQTAQQPTVAELDLMLSPNPARGQVNLQLFTTATQATQINILDARGKEVFRRTVPAEQAQLTLSVADWPAGIYFVRLIQGKEGITRKLVIR